MKPKIGKELQEAIKAFSDDWAPHEAARPEWQKQFTKVVTAAMCEGASQLADKISGTLPGK